MAGRYVDALSKIEFSDNASTLNKKKHRSPGGKIRLAGNAVT
jgi:hypothetical protein